MAERFQTTRWSIVLSARSAGTASPGDEEGARRALQELCSAYWRPVHGFVHRSVRQAESARDLTQAFFLHLIEKRALRGVDPSLGRFRSFLVASLRHFLANEREREAALKRGGGRVVVSLEALDSEGDAMEARPMADPEAEFDRAWALTVLRRVLQRFDAELEREGRAGVARLLRPHVFGDGGRPLRDLAEEIGRSEGAVKMLVHRLRRRYGRMLREEIAETVLDDARIDDELRHLLEAVRG